MKIAFLDIDENLNSIAVVAEEKNTVHLSGNLEEVLEKSKIDQRTATVIGLSRNLFVSRKISLPDISLENVKEALSYKVKKIFSFIKEPLFFYLPTNTKNEYMVLATEKENVSKITTTVKSKTEAKIAGITLTGLFVAEITKEPLLVIKRKSHAEVIKKFSNRITDYNIVKKAQAIPQHEECYLCNLCNLEESDCIKVIEGNLQRLLDFMSNNREGTHICFNIAPALTESLKSGLSVPPWLVKLAVVSSIFLLVSPYIYFYKSLKHLKNTEKNLEKRVIELKKQIKRQEEIEKYIKSMQRLTSPYVLDVLAEVGRLIGSRMEILNIYINRSRVKITGYSEKSAEIVTLLEKSPLLTNVRLSGAIIRARKGKERFTIEATIVR